MTTTLEEYLGDAERITYQLSVIVAGRQVFVHEAASRKAWLEGVVRYGNLTAPRGLLVHKAGNGWASFLFGDVRLVVWPALGRYPPPPPPRCRCHLKFVGEIEAEDMEFVSERRFSKSEVRRAYRKPSPIDGQPEEGER